MNAVIDGEVLPIAEARSRRMAYLKERGIDRPRVPIGRYYNPAPMNLMDAEAELIQQAMLGGRSWRIV